MTGLEDNVLGLVLDTTWVYPDTEPILRSVPSGCTWKNGALEVSPDPEN
jgi:hypothetical protein